MDCIQSIQKAIDYMEMHILEKLSYEDVAKELYMSNYHFHRLFSMITGMTVNESISEENNTEIPDFWNMCGEKGIFKLLRENVSNHDIYGICAPISKESTYFDYGIGMLYDDGNVPEG